MFRLFGKKGAGAIGLDMSDNSIEAVQLKQGLNGFQLIAWSRQVLPTGLRENGQIVQKEKLAVFLREFFLHPKFGRFEGSNIIVNIPEEKVFSHVFEFSPPIKQGLENRLIQELPALIPADLKTLAWDWQETHRNSIKQEIFWAGTPKVQANQLKELFRLLGFNLAAVDLESAALARATVKELPEKTGVVLLDIGSETTLIAIYDNYGIRSSYNVARGGQFFTQEIARQLNISLKEAEIKKRKLGFTAGAEGGKLLSILQAAIQLIVEEVNKSIEFYKSRTGQKIAKVILTGGSSLMPNIDYHLAQALQLEIEKGKLWIDLEPSLAEKEQVLLPISVGLALRGLADNFGANEGINLLKRL